MSAPRRSKDWAEDPTEDNDAEESAQEDDPDVWGGEAQSEKDRDETTALAPVTASSDRDQRAVSPNDPLRRYLEEVRRYPLLSPEEEIELATRMREKGDLDAAKTLVSANLRLVVKIAYEYRNIYTSLLDLVQEGNIGLMKAVSKFDPLKGARLGYYASWWIRSYILKFLLDNFRLVKLGTTQAQKKLFYHLMREKQKLEALGVADHQKLIADRLHVREKDVAEMAQRLDGSGSEASIDRPIRSDGDDKLLFVHQMADDRESAEDSLEREELLATLRGRLPEFETGLNAREKQVLRDRLLAEEPKTLQEIADSHGLTRERARQIEAHVIRKLREFLRGDLGLP